MCGIFPKTLHHYIYQVVFILCIFLTNNLMAEINTETSIEQKTANALQNEQFRQQELQIKENYKQQSEQRWKIFEALPPGQNYKPPETNSSSENSDISNTANNLDSQENKCIKLEKIELIGIEKFPLLTRIALNKNVKSLTQHCITSDILMNKLAAAISSTNQILFEKGYVTSRAHMVEQDISESIFQINITAGTIVHYQTQGLSTWQTALVMPSGLLNYNYLNNGLDNLKKNRSNKTELKIIPGSRIGESDILLDNTQGKLWHSQITIKNDHADKKNYASGNITLNIDNILGSNDLWSFVINESLKERSQQKNQLLSANLLIPIRRSTLQLNTSKSEFFNHIEGNNVVFKASGLTEKRSLSIDYLLLKTTKSTLLFDWEMTQKKDNNLISDATIDIQSGVTRSQASGLNYKLKLSDHFMAHLKSTQYQGSFTGYDTGIDIENKQQFKRYFHEGIVSFQKQAWQLQLENYLQESQSQLINDQRFSLYTIFIPGIAYIPANEGKLHTLKTSYTFQKNAIFFTPEFQISHSSLKNSGDTLEVSGFSIKNITQWKKFSSLVEVGKAIKSAQENNDLAGSIAFNFNF